MACAFFSSFLPKMERLNLGPSIDSQAGFHQGGLVCKATIAQYPKAIVGDQEKLKAGEIIKIGVLGASGYTGSEIVRLLATHPFFKITLMTADRKAGQPLASVFPHLVSQDLPTMVAVKDADFSQIDAVFCCLPHGTTQEIISALPDSLKVVDLSADFRLHDVKEYEEWYNRPHAAVELQKQAVYGLTELKRKAVIDARLVANPGCYPTSIQLPLAPLLQAKLISSETIIIDAKSGVSGAGRSAKESNLYTEISEGLNAYGVTKHRHGKSSVSKEMVYETCGRINLFCSGIGRAEDVLSKLSNKLRQDPECLQ